MPARLNISRASRTWSSPIQQVTTGLSESCAAAITAWAASFGLVMAWGVRITSKPSTCSSPRQADTATR